MKGATLFSGIGAPELAAPWIDWRWCAEIDPFASAVLKTRFPSTKNHGDVLRFPDAVEPVQLIVFGSPCQSFSVAGKRAGLDDPRGNMALVGLQIVERVQPRWVVWENVPGILSSDEWRDFGAFLGLLGQCGYGFAYRVLDAQYFGVPQRRRRVFVVGHLGDWRPAAAVLFEPESLRGDIAPRREAGEGIAADIAGSLNARGNKCHTELDGHGAYIPIQSVQSVREKRQNGIGIGEDNDPLFTLTKRDQHAVAGHFEQNSMGGRGTLGWNEGGQPVRPVKPQGDHQMLVTHTLRADGFDASEDGTGRGVPLVPVMAAGAARANGAGIGRDGDPMFTLDSTGAQAIAFDAPQSDVCVYGDQAAVLDSDGYTQAVAYSIRSDAMREGKALTPSADAEGHVRLRDPGLGIYADLAPTVDAGQAHAVAFHQNQRNEVIRSDTMWSLKSGGGGKPGQGYPAIAFTERTRADGRNFEAQEDLAYALCNPGSGGRTHSRQLLDPQMSVRRLMPRECERLQGFPDDFTAISYRGKPTADGPRYRALGNAMAVPVIGWILRRIRLLEESEHVA